MTGIFNTKIIVGYLSRRLYLALAIFVLTGTLFVGCTLTYESELLDSHNALVEIDKKLVQSNEHVLDSHRAFTDEYNKERFDLGNANYEALRSRLTQIEQGMTAAYQFLQQKSSAVARFAGYASSLKDSKKQSSEEFINNIKLSDRYCGMAMDELREAIRQYNAALDLFQRGSFDEGNKIIDQAEVHLGRYEENISLQNDYANKVTESESRLIIAMGWKELE